MPHRTHLTPAPQPASHTPQARRLRHRDPHRRKHPCRLRTRPRTRPCRPAARLSPQVPRDEPLAVLHSSPHPCLPLQTGSGTLSGSTSTRAFNASDHPPWQRGASGAASASSATGGAVSTGRQHRRQEVVPQANEAGGAGTARLPGFSATVLCVQQLHHCPPELSRGSAGQARRPPGHDHRRAAQLQGAVAVHDDVQSSAGHINDVAGRARDSPLLAEGCDRRTGTRAAGPGLADATFMNPCSEVTRPSDGDEFDGHTVREEAGRTDYGRDAEVAGVSGIVDEGNSMRVAHIDSKTPPTNASRADLDPAPP